MRPLTLEELSCAISVSHIGHTSEIDMRVLKEDDIHNMFGDFVVYNGDTVSIAHSTAGNFLEREYFKGQAQNSDMLIAERCISYLSNPDLRNTLPQDFKLRLELRLEKYQRFRYAAEHWHEHFIIANAEGSNLNRHVLDMLSDESIVTSIYNTINASKQENGVTGLHLAALCGLGTIVDILVNHSKNRRGPLGDSKQHTSWLDKRTGSGETALHYAIRGNRGGDNLEMIKKLLCHGINPNIRSKDGQTVLHQAIALKQNAAALGLASTRKDKALPCRLLVDMPDEQGYTHLMSAVKQGMLEVAKALIDADADVHKMAEDGCSALEIATDNNYRELVVMLLRMGAKTRSGGISILHWAVQHNYQEIISQLYVRGEDMNLVTSQGSPIICAVRHGHIKLVDFLLKRGAKLDVPGPDGNTALHIAAEKNAEPIMRLLLESGANPNVRNKDGDMAIHIATARDDGPVLNVLLQHPHGGKPAIEALNESCWMPIHVAAREGAMSTARWLISAGADVNAVSSDGFSHTPLHIAAEQGKRAAEFIEFLITTCKGSLGLDLDCKDAWDRTPLQVAVNSDNEPAVRALLAGRANPNPINVERLTPLHEAAVKERVMVVKALLEYNADIEGDEGDTVVEKAILRMNAGKGDGKVMLATFLNAGVDITRQAEIDGKTPLHLAAFLGLMTAIEMMYDKAVPPPDSTIKDFDGMTAVQVIAQEHEINWKWGT